MYLIMDHAWKFGCGRYIQKPGAILDLSKEFEKLGNKALVLAGPHAWEAVSNEYPDILCDIPHVFCIHSTPCSEEAAKAYSEIVLKEHLDVVIGIGGGKIMDMAKLVADFTGTQVINIPTICATCAAYTALSVIYTPEGKARGSWFFEKEVSCILADTTILSRQPARYATAGIIDSMAKIIEINHNINYLSETPDMRMAKCLADYIFNQLTQIAEEIHQHLSVGIESDVINEMIYLIIAGTGVVSGAARGQGQSAMAHTLYETIRTLYPKESASSLHGEIVGVGLRIQQRYDNSDTAYLDSMMSKLKAPMRLRDLYIPESEEQLRLISETMVENPLIKAQNIDPIRLEYAIANL